MKQFILFLILLNILFSCTSKQIPFSAKYHNNQYDRHTTVIYTDLLNSTRQLPSIYNRDVNGQVNIEENNTSSQVDASNPYYKMEERNKKFFIHNSTENINHDIKPKLIRQTIVSY